MTTLPPRVLGALTAVYGVHEVIHPGHLARITRLGDENRPSGAIRALSAVLGLRDIGSGLAMVLAPQGPPLRAAIAARAAFDFADAAAFGAACPPEVRTKVIATPALFGLICAASATWSGRRP